MGEFADYELESVIEMENLRFAHLHGDIDDETAADLGIIDYTGAFNSHRRSAFTQTRQLKCKWCGLIGVYWDKDKNNKWRLFETKSGNLHTCKEYQYNKNMKNNKHERKETK